MKKELSPSLEMVACDVCGRTILKGERTEPYRIPDGSRRRVCELCTRRAESAGWLRESLHGELPATAPRAEPRRSLLGRLRRRFELDSTEQAPVQPAPPAQAGRWSESLRFRGGGRSEADVVRGEVRGPAQDRPAPDEAGPPGDGGYVEEPATTGAPQSDTQPSLDQGERMEDLESPADDRAEPAPLVDETGGVHHEPLHEGSAHEGSALSEPPPEEAPHEVETTADARAERRERRERRRVRDPRHVRAVPTGAEAKVERALEIFNLSDYRRTVGGLVRTLGAPWVTAKPHEGSTGEVTVVVAWELSWYQFRVDLGDSTEPVAVADKGHEVAEIDAELRRWNATATEDGALVPSVPAA